ncbi:hypothetical protein HMPREF0291_12155 [Corynebacterium genitalium ATCC 33030]|uniref:DUF2178 domain-containing protein n=2 Tax=Corynebacteriaceae TaxID=1653 RepID=D7WES2_9CORY|nr:hypothetical protein HMPREF0291_12155 [Corynebacterium genitalium ATCC 33030]
MLSYVENKGDAMNVTEVNKSLAAVRDIEARAAQVPIPWGMVTAAGLTFGLGVGIMVAGYVWGLLVFLVSLVLMIVLDFGSKRTVRTAMKQDVQSEENTWSWKRFFTFIVLYTIAYIGMQVYADHYPDGNTAVGIVVGIIAAAAMIAGYGLTWRKYH